MLIWLHYFVGYALLLLSLLPLSVLAEDVWKRQPITIHAVIGALILIVLGIGVLTCLLWPL